MSNKPMLSAVVASTLFLTLIAISPIVVTGQDTIPPEVSSYYPLDGSANIPLAASIFVNFSESMNQLTVGVLIDPTVALIHSWDGMSKSLLLSHMAQFSVGTRYTVTVDGEDIEGNPIDGDHDGVGGDPFIWSFVTDCGGSCILQTVPFDRETNVAIDTPIIVTFDEKMNIATVTVSIVPSVVLTASWTNGDTMLTLDHSTPFLTCTVHQVTITAPGLVAGPVPNPWQFTTTGCPPVIIGLSPSQSDVPLDAPILIVFSTTMNNASVSWTLNKTPTLSPQWDSGNTTLNLSHADKFYPCTAYSFSIAGKDMFGQILQNGSFPMPYNFTTVCTYPKVLQTSPGFGQGNVPLDAPIVVIFSESMDTKSVEAAFYYKGLQPRIFNITDGTSAWTQENMTFTFSPNIPYIGLITYSVYVNATAHGLGNNPLDGNSNGIPEGHPTDDYAWQFTTAEVTDTVAPWVQSVSPSNGAANVPRTTAVVVIFSESMNRLSVQLAVGVSGSEVAYNFSWSNNKTVSFNLIPTPLHGTSYTITIAKTAEDLVGNQMVSNYIWTFTTEFWRGDVYGKVVDDADDSPIANATVTYNGVQILTDSDGNFVFRNAEQGTHVFNVSKEGYDSNSKVASVGPGLQDLGTIRLLRTRSTPQADVPWAVIAALIIVVIILLLLAVFLSRRRRKARPATFEQWRGEVAEIETGEQER